MGLNEAVEGVYVSLSQSFWTNKNKVITLVMINIQYETVENPAVYLFTKSIRLFSNYFVQLARNDQRQISVAMNNFNICLELHCN